MKKIKFIVLAVSLISAVFFASCKSTPEPEPAPSPAPVEKESEPESAPVEIIKDYTEENKVSFEKIDSARQSAIDAGAEKVNPLGWAAAEAELKAEQAAFQTTPAADLSIALDDLEARYNALASQAKAVSLKARIDELDFSSYAQSNYNNGCAALDELSLPTANIAKGKDLFAKASTAEESFVSVLKSGFRVLAKAERSDSVLSKKNADSVKAAVSKATDYSSAVEKIKAADQNYATGNPEEAYNLYKEASGIFQSIYEDISTKRDAVLAAIEAAKAKVANSEAAAKEADQKAPLGDQKVQGIEDADAKLLEDDSFAEYKSEDVGDLSE